MTIIIIIIIIVRNTTLVVHILNINKTRKVYSYTWKCEVVRQSEFR